MVLLYKGTTFDYTGKISLSSLMVEALRPELEGGGESDDPLIMHLRYVRKPDPRLVDGPRTIHNLRSQISWLG